MIAVIHNLVLHRAFKLSSKYFLANLHNISIFMFLQLFK